MEGQVCTSCGRPFFGETFKLELTHPNLFNGVDYLCKACVTRMAKKSKEALKCIKESKNV